MKHSDYKDMKDFLNIIVIITLFPNFARKVSIVHESQQEPAATNEIGLKTLSLLSENFEYYM